MRKLFAACTAALLLSAAVPTFATAAESHADPIRREIFNGDQKIVFTIFKPAAAASADVPVILESHGWNGSRKTAIGGMVAKLLDAGFGVVSIDQRGHGESGGQAHVQDPTRETEDIKKVIDHIATLDWVAHNTDPTGAPLANDPVLGAIGGSYGGGYQTMTALDEIADQGDTRFDALAPEITWYDLPESLAPQAVPRTAWTALLYAAGADMLPTYVHQGQLWGASTGQWPDGTIFGQPVPGVPNLDEEFHKHGPAFFAERGIKLDVPVLLRQGTSDNLFNLNQGLDIFTKALTDEAREESYFVAYNGGHDLPNVAPLGAATRGDICSGGETGWDALRIDFFRRAFAGSTDGLLPNRYNLTDQKAQQCIRADFLDGSRSVNVVPMSNRAITTTAAGAPQHIEVAQGPITVTGVPRLSGKLTSVGIDSRAFFALSVGTSPTNATVVQNNVMPLRQNLPVTDRAFDIELPGVVVDVPAGQKLFLTVSPVSDMFFAHGSRTPGGLILSDLSLTLPQPAFHEVAEPRPSAMTLVVDGTGSKSQLVATLTDAESGAPIAGAAIDFSADGAPLGTATTDGAGVASLPLERRLRGGSHAFGATFSGNDDYTATSASTNS